MHVTNGNLSLHVADDGDPSAPPILLLHGIIGSGATWDWFVPELAERFRVLRLDFRGHGRSDRAPGAYDVDGYVSDAVAALEQAAGRPCVAIGHSLGGGTAAAVTQRRPELLTGAVMEDPPLGPTTGEPLSLEGHALLDGFRLMRDSIPQLQASNIPLAALVDVIAGAPDTSGSGTFGEVLHADALETMARSMLEVDAAVLDPVLAGTAEAFLDPAVPFGVPTLLVAADPAKPDAVATVGSAEHYAAISHRAEVLVMEGAGHLIHDDRRSRDRFRTAVLSFLDGVTPP